MVDEIRKELPKSVSKACRVLGLSRSVLHYRSIKDDSTYVDLLRKHAEDHPREGFWKAYGHIRNQGVVVNHKRLFRIYQQTGMSLRRKCKRRLPNREKQPLAAPDAFTQGWSIDFTSDALSNGRKFRSFNVIDDYNREVLYIEVDYSLKSSRVVWVLNHLINRYNLIVTSLGISLSTSRGILFEKLNTSGIHNVVIPVVSPIKMLQKPR